MKTQTANETVGKGVDVVQVVRQLLKLKNDLHELKVRIQMTGAELTTTLNSLNDQVDKIAAEIVTLQGALTNVSIPQDAVDSLNRLVGKVQAADDLNPG